MTGNYTVLLFTYNEERRVEYILRNFRGRAHVVLLDDGSTDQTQSIAERYSASFIRRPKTNCKYLEREIRQWALDQAETQYVFISYASFFVPADLLKVFDMVSNQERYRAIKHDSLAITYGAFIQRPVVRRQSSACHFFCKDDIDFSSSRIHEEWPLCVPRDQILTVEPTDNLSVYVFRDYDVKRMELKCSDYADEDAKERFEKGDRTTVGKMLWSAIHRFIHGYIRSGGFMAGVPGLIYHMGWAQMTFNIQARLWEYQAHMTRDESREVQDRMREKMLADLDAVSPVRSDVGRERKFRIW
jgi:glycosyltransferase involved in cell wall biosynthesis